MSLYGSLSWRDDWRVRILGGFLGLSVGDALGLPWETRPKWVVRREWGGDMDSGDRWGHPPGYWSDDTGQMLALAWALIKYGDNVEGFAEELLRWWRGEDHNIDGPPFGYGSTTAEAIGNLLRGVPPDRSGSLKPSCGSLMRNLPLAIYSVCFPLEEALELAHRFSRVTHAHPLSEMACGLHSVIVRGIMSGEDLESSIDQAGIVLGEYYANHPRYSKYVENYSFLFVRELLYKEPEKGSCRPHEAFRASLWALVTSRNYKETVVKAVRLGADTDTIAAIAGGLAGLYYGVDSIPKGWLEKLKARWMIEKAAKNLAEVVYEKCIR